MVTPMAKLPAAFAVSLQTSLSPCHIRAEYVKASASNTPDAIVDAFWSLHVQQRSAWTLELDLRPYKETF